MSWWDRRVYKSTALAGNGNQGLVSSSDQSFSGIKDFRDGVIIGEASPGTPAEGNFLYSSSGELISIDEAGDSWSLNPKFVDYTPTFGAASGAWTPTIEVARYAQVGKITYIIIRLLAGNQTVDTAYLTMTLPATAKNYSGGAYNQAMSLFLFYAGGTRVAGYGFALDNSTTMQIYRADLGTILAGNASILMTGFYEAD